VRATAARRRKGIPAEDREGELRLQAFGVTEPRPAPTLPRFRTTATKKDGRYVINGQKSDFARRALDLMLLSRSPRRARSAEEDRRPVGVIVDMKAAPRARLTIRPIRTMINHADHRDFHRQPGSARENLVGEEGKASATSSTGMNAERVLIGAECIGDAKWFLAKASRLRQ